MLDVRETLEVPEDTQASKIRGSRMKPVRKAGDGDRSGKPKGLKVNRFLVKEGATGFDGVEWEQRKASITDDKGNVIFEQPNVEVPKSWSMLATNIVASKYFFGGIGTEERERSVRQLIHRVARTIADWGLKNDYFETPEDAEIFYNELCHICVNQYGSFNSPVWFNVGLYQVYGHMSGSRTSYCWDKEDLKIGSINNTYERPQASACFIQSVDDTMEDIMRLASTEAMLFKYGSGTGTDLSTLRSSKEKLSGGGVPSGPLSFMRVFDQVAAVIKSGGKTRRAAKMQSLKIDHPDIREFVRCKMQEEKKAWALIDQGYDGSFGGEAYDSVMFQNSNLSVRVTDEFMRAVENDSTFSTKAVVTGDKVEAVKAKDLMRDIAEGTHVCGDPGLQYDTTINSWNTCINSGRINASNPCSEFMFVDDSACNLASINLMKLIDDEGIFDVEKFGHIVRMFVIAQDILVDSASYPTHQIAENSHLFRPLGLGYANLGALLMRLGLPYDSNQGRAFAGAITALMTGKAYSASQEMAESLGTFDKYEDNTDCMSKVMKKHSDSLNSIEGTMCPSYLKNAAVKIWGEVQENAPMTGFRNAQVTLLAPTGTIGFMMDCDTTGIEPDIALVKYKQLAGGGVIKMVNRTLRPALKRLGYTEDAMEAIVKHVDEHDTIENAPGLKSEHLEVFDCAFKPKNGKRYISYKAHLRMMAAVQTFLSGAISKTVNVPTETTIDEIMQTYMEGWKLGLKSVAIYRDGSKRTQPLNTGKVEGKKSASGKKGAQAVVGMPFRRRMSPTRQSITHKFEVANHKGYLTVGMHEDGSPGELFITMAKEGSTVGGTMDAFGTAISLCLQYGVPVQELCRKFAHSRFEPAGFTKNPEIPIAKSIVDYIFRWLDVTFPNGKVRGSQCAPAPVTASAPASGGAAKSAGAASAEAHETQRVDEQFKGFMDDAPACDLCGAITVRNGACYRCYNCGNSMGCS